MRKMKRNLAAAAACALAVSMVLEAVEKKEKVRQQGELRKRRSWKR